MRRRDSGKNREGNRAEEEVGGGEGKGKGDFVRWLNVFNAVVSGEVLAGTEIPGCGGRGRLYTYRYSVPTRMTPALR